MKYIDKLSFEEKIDIDDFDFVCFCPEINEYMLVITVPYVSYYSRYYWISEEDFKLAKNNLIEFKNKYKDAFNSVMELPKGITFMGAEALRDYDGRQNFQNYITTGIKDIVNPFQHFLYKDKVLYAHIIMNGSHYAVIPYRITKNEQGEYIRPLENEKNVEMFYSNVNGEKIPLFMGIKINWLENN